MVIFNYQFFFSLKKLFKEIRGFVDRINDKRYNGGILFLFRLFIFYEKKMYNLNKVVIILIKY